MDNQELTKEQKKAKREQLERGAAFEELVRTKGFEHLKAYFQNQLTSFVNQVMSDETKPLTEFEPLRHQIIGIKKMMGEVEWSIKAIENERQAK